MATVRDRAQLILVGGLSLALVLVVVALVLNSAIYTENLASRTNGDASSDAVLFSSDLRHGVERTIRYSNEQSMSGSQTASTMNSIGNEMARNAGKRGAAVAFTEVDSTDIDSGLQFAQTSDGTFESDSGAANYTVANDTDVRDYRMKIDPSTASSFRLQFVGDSNTRTLDFDINSTHITVDQVETGETCTRSVDDGRVNVSEGTIEGHDCPALDVFGDLSSDYDIAVTGGDKVNGQYHFVIDDAADSTHALSGTSAVYAITVDYSYQTKDLYYETTLRVAPGEADA